MMPNDNRSFFEKLTGSVPEEELVQKVSADSLEQESPPEEKLPGDNDSRNTHEAVFLNQDESMSEEHADEGQLTVDVYQTPTHIVVQAPMAGVKPDDVDVSINRDMITIRGVREQKREADTNNYYYRELFWGPFSRSVLLPEEVDSDRTEASFKAGLLTVKMPKINKDSVQRVKIEAKEI